MATSLPSAGPADHQGRPPTDPGSLSGVITGTGPGPRGATISTVTTTVSAAPPRPPLVRPRSGRAIAGVAVGTAVHLRQDPLVVRVAFVLLATTGIGIVAYALLWLTMPVAAPGDEHIEPTPGWRPRGARQWIATVVLGLVAVSLLSGLSRWNNSVVILPLVLVAAGLTVIWRQLDTDRTLAVAGTRWTLAGGVVLAGAGLVILLATTGQLANARNGFGATLVLLTGLLLATAPLWRRLVDSRDEERAARIRSEERAAVAAHLHDSVLQTLALIQRHADDQQSVGRLARSQERELRAWLYDPKVVREGGTWAGLVAGMVAEVENDHALVVDHVVVGDAPIDEALASLGAATREALVNVAKHSGVTAADLYTEVTPDRVSVFVRDRGAGFDAELVPSDRRGLRDSVTGRITRLGGTALIRSAPGEGTEVELALPRAASS